MSSHRSLTIFREQQADRIAVNNQIIDDSVLSEDALDFVHEIFLRFGPRLSDLLVERVKRQEELDAGSLPNFLEETRSIRDSDWMVAPPPRDLLDRRVEITGPPDRKMTINALNSGANVFMADFEDSLSPTWRNVILGQVNLRDAVRRSITYTHPATGKRYELNDETATLFVRPRGLHLHEKNLLTTMGPVPASIVDFGLFFFHNATELQRRGSSVYMYLPKLEHHLEARWWNDVINWSEEKLGIPVGSTRTTVLIETIPAVFQMDEILWELHDRSVGLNCGRWDYIFSYVKTFKEHPDRCLPDRSNVGMDRHCMESYAKLLIHTCHRRGAHAMGGMSAQIPIKGDPKSNEVALGSVREDKIREVELGHDGTWVAHPGLVALAKEVFDTHMPAPNQVNPVEKSCQIDRMDILAHPQGDVTEAGLSHNVDVCLRYVVAWLSGNGCVPIYNLMEDAATAEISRVQIWQWIRHGVRTDSGEVVTFGKFADYLNKASRAMVEENGLSHEGLICKSCTLLRDVTDSHKLRPFLTSLLYDNLEKE